MLTAAKRKFLDTATTINLGDAEWGYKNGDYSSFLAGLTRGLLFIVMHDRLFFYLQLLTAMLKTYPQSQLLMKKNIRAIWY